MGNWMALFSEIEACEKCGLCQARTHVVPGEGDPHADVMFVGEGPGADEDRQGRPFVGASGMLLNSMLKAIDISRSDVYIANIAKCRPPANRTPTADEAAACLPYLRRQIELVKPKIIVALGGTAARYLIDEDVRIRRDHGQWKEIDGISMMATYHPSALLRDASQKRDAWADFCTLRDRLKEINGNDD